MANPLRKTMVYLGLADEEYEEVAPEQTNTSHTSVTARPAPVTPLPKSHTSASETSQILTIQPRRYSEAATIAESFREGVSVIINLTQMEDAEAQRLIDFAGGLSMGLYGKLERITNKVFLLSPEHVVVAGEPQEAESKVQASFFAS